MPFDMLYTVYTIKLARRAAICYAGRASSMFVRRLLDVCSMSARCLLLCVGYALYPVYTVKQTSSNHRANIQQMHLKYMCSNCSMSARRLLRVGYALCMLHDCLMFARCLLDRVNGVLHFCGQTTHCVRQGSEGGGVKTPAKVTATWRIKTTSDSAFYQITLVLYVT